MLFLNKLYYYYWQSVAAYNRNSCQCELAELEHDSQLPARIVMVFINALIWERNDRAMCGINYTAQATY